MIEIGNWVQRKGQKWHLVDSTVATRVVTRCGREMEIHSKRGDLERSPIMPLSRLINQPQLCKGGCDDGQ